MKVSITRVLSTILQADNLNDQVLIEKFEEWKCGDEYGSYLFGKDSAYSCPKINGKLHLRHVHLPPLIDAIQLERWNKQWKRRGRKTSDRVLIYVQDQQDNYLLIFILPEPQAHAVAKMKTSEDKTLMENFATVAAEFLETGNIII